MKTKTGITLGPWKVSSKTGQSIAIETVSTHHVNSMDAFSGKDLSGQRSDLIARVSNGPGLSQGDGESNARLIALAPEMLLTMVKVAENIHKEDGCRGDFCHACELLRPIERAEVGAR